MTGIFVIVLFIVVTILAVTIWSMFFAEPNHNNTSATGTSTTTSSSTPRPAPLRSTSGNGPLLTYLLQANVAKQGWVTAQKSSGKLSGFGTINATDDELPDFAKGVIEPFDDGKRTMRVVFFRGDLSFDELSIESTYGDVTPSEGGRFSPWLFMG